MNTSINKIAYILFILLSIYQACFNKDFMQAAASLGIGLVFDPFNQDVKWNDRPYWQRAVLIIHLALVAALVGLGIGLKNR